MSSPICYFNARFLEPIMRFAGVKDVRYYLNGIHVEPSSSGGVLLVATNGHIVIVARDPDGYAPRRMAFTPDRKLIQAARSKDAGMFVVFHGFGVITDQKHDFLAAEMEERLIEQARVVGKVSPIDNPEGLKWKQMLSNKLEQRKGRPASGFSVNSKYLAVMKDCFEAMRDHKCLTAVTVDARDDTDAIILRPDGNLEALALIMPMRFTGDIAGNSWMDLPAPTVNPIPVIEKPAKPRHRIRVAEDGSWSYAPGAS